MLALILGLVITGGSVTVTSQLGEFDFGNETFSASGTFPTPNGSGSWGDLGGMLVAGDEMHVSGIQTHNDLAGAVITMEGTVYDVRLNSLMAEKGSGLRFAGPSILLDHGAGLYSGSFTFDGWICGTVHDPAVRDEPCIVDLPELFGQGSVSLNVVLDVIHEGRQLYMIDSVNYTFETEGAPVPEPGTLEFLYAGFLVWGVARSGRVLPLMWLGRDRRRRKGQTP